MIAGVVLAAGRSSRLGRPKQLLPLQGEPLLRRTLRQVLAASLDEVLVVVGHEAEAMCEAVAGLPVRVVFNPDFALGQSTSVRAGLAALAPGTEAAMFLLGDQPGIDPEVIAALVAAWRQSNSPIVTPRYTDGIGNPVLFDQRVFPELAGLRGDTGARAIVRAREQQGELHAVAIPLPAPTDIDTDADYAALLASLSNSRYGAPFLPAPAGEGGRRDKDEPTAATPPHPGTIGRCTSTSPRARREAPPSPHRGPDHPPD